MAGHHQVRDYPFSLYLTAIDEHNARAKGK